MNKVLLVPACLWALGIHPFSLSVAGPLVIGEKPPVLELEKVLRAPAGTVATWEALKGKVVVLDFWATWCGPCVESIPHWNKLAAQFSGKPIVFLAISDENEAVVAAFLKRKPIESWIGLDGVGASMCDRFGIRGIPTTVIVNQEGLVVAVTHPAKLEAKHLDEVLSTRRSSLPPPRDRDEEAETVPVSSQPALFEVTIRRSAPRQPGRGFNAWSFDREGHEMRGETASVKSALSRFFDVRESLLRLRAKLPEEDYDFVVRVPSGSRSEIERLFAAAIGPTFGLQARRVPEEQDVLVARIAHTNTLGLKPTDPTLRSRGGGQGHGQLKLDGLRIDSIFSYLEDWFEKPVFNETGLTNRYDIRLKWTLSETELLTQYFDRPILRAVKDKGTNAWKRLSEHDRRVVAAIKGELPEGDFKQLEGELQGKIELMRRELAKPEDKQFLPEKSAITQALEEQLGLKLTPARRTLDVLVVEQNPDMQRVTDTSK